ncbi:MAG: hypothetical protein A3F74_08245 [Betaproteobacteria bacterium RIFCSPLOWO2_12_FULL_62_58]|nr:MAG: hypothetical protein A3F74_08245 [Betaproteobacteria bacterium RIFCSPLOWO2_12_FULL_62_58]
MDRTDSALASAASELAARRYDFAANRAYYACFYAASAVLLVAGRKFTKHSGVRGAVHQELVKPGLLDATWGRAYRTRKNVPQALDRGGATPVAVGRQLHCR